MSAFATEMENKNYIVHPHKFGLWLFILSLIMIFGGLTSAYIITGGITGGNRVLFDLPGILWNNTAIILFSSVTLQFAVWSFKKDQTQRAMIGLILTFILGLVFMIGQFYAWEEMVGQKLFFVNDDPSVSFFYVFTGLHALHIIGGLVVLLFVIARSSSKKVSKERVKRMYDLTATFWHFLDLLWIYLFLFLLYTQQ